ncbi:MAG: sugar ABC transporter ATP-binding protein [Actinobacteria bacterium]|nr:MAG: sugar ABC transporter ATP-binding protein [Actinomycetota bacterium]
MSDPTTQPLLELRAITKSYGGVHALADVSFAIRAGTVHALVGENGAGKSTLVKIITGVVEPDEGEVLIDGEPVWIGDAQTAHKLGIVAMYQEPTVFPDLSVAENVFAGRHPRSRMRTVDWGAMQSEAKRILRELGVDFGPDTPVRGLGVADRQLLEIAKALSTNARLLIMDEPTAALSPNEVDNLFVTVRKLRDRGVAVIYISHRLEEVGELADTVTVLRDGRHIDTRPARELSHGEIIRLMVGRSLDALFPKEDAEIGDVVLSAKGLTRRGIFADVSFELRRGEIVGLAGFVGAGRTEVAMSIFGVDPLDAGRLEILGRPFRPRSPRAALHRGLAYLPEDRLHQGLVQPMSVSDNLSMAVLPGLTPGGFLRPRRERALARRFMEQLRIKARSPAQVVRSLSGGNQQKVVLGKWLAAEPRILILDEPTHGVDVGTKADVHRTISHLATQGLTILLISSELPEILGMSDRVLVMREGRLVAELSRDEATQERVIQAAAGVEAVA